MSKTRIWKISLRNTLVQSLLSVPAGSDIFIDANIFVYGLSNASAQCRLLLERCSREEVAGITLFEIVNEATHKLMLAEAVSKAVIPRPGSAAALRLKYLDIPLLIDYWHDTERILALNLLFLSTDEHIVRSAQPERQSAGVLTNDYPLLDARIRNPAHRHRRPRL
ncbi:MAG: hypothetical protein HYR60_27210 [Acidobacteria bacterium]|nr:hypothetical protein [Acidobacteriota bacterium]